ncbi:MAG TPA: hypothetical protein VJM11_10615 [Nevskiaceae bacterium]|nr:hypothetical protein [Nevskiaceae bacterium]
MAPARAGPPDHGAPPAAPSAQEAFDTAVDLTREGRFEEALDAFALARRAGDDSPRLHFNLGVVQYRLGQLDQARDAFAVAARDAETADLARYNLGLVAMAAGDDDTAARWFGIVARDADRDDLRGLATAALARLGGGSRRNRGSLLLLRGDDSNVILPVGSLADTPSSVRDGFWEVRAAWSGQVADEVPELEVHLAGYADEYDSVEDANVAVIEAGVEWRGPVLADVTASLTNVGNAAYQRSIDLRLVPTLYAGERLRLSTELVAAGIASVADGAEGLEGEQYGVAPVVDLWWLETRWSLMWRHLWNERRAADLSPEQDAVSLRARRAFGPFSVRLWARWVGSDYPTGRDDDATEIGAGLGWEILSSLELIADVSRQENDSSQPVFAYETTRVTGGLRVRF